MGEPKREACRHKMIYWCQECVTEAANLAEACGREAGLNTANEFVRSLASAAFLRHDDNLAKVLREIAEQLEIYADKAKKVTHEIRKVQMPEVFK